MPAWPKTETKTIPEKQHTQPDKLKTDRMNAYQCAKLQCCK